jgi:thiamine pyrophosphokinase
MRTVIFANGSLSHPKIDLARIRPDDRLIAANGGAQHCMALGLIPTVLIGDFDSLEPEEMEALEQYEVILVTHPTSKDKTDLDLAVIYAMESGATEILILAGMGDRWDQSLANLLLPATAELKDVRITLIDGPQEATILHSGGSLELSGQSGDTVSLIPLGGSAYGVTSHGLEYHLENDTLYFGSTRGISNVLQGNKATLHLKQGTLACIMIHSFQQEDL